MAGKKNKRDVKDFMASKGGRIQDAIPEAVYQKACESDTYAMSVDQSLDCTGIAFLLPGNDVMAVQQFICDTICEVDERFRGRYQEMCQALKKIIASPYGGPLELLPENRQKLKVAFGHVLPKNTDGSRKILLVATIQKSPSDQQEIYVAKDTSKTLAKVAEQFIFMAGTMAGKSLAITLEGMAVRATKATVAGLPVLGIVWGFCWDALLALKSTKDYSYELPISSWKKCFAGHGDLSKDGVADILTHLGFGRVATDDERDAVAMALVAASHLKEVAEKERLPGRIRPTREKSKADREVRKIQKALKKERAEERERRKAEKAATKAEKAAAKAGGKGARTASP